MLPTEPPNLFRVSLNSFDFASTLFKLAVFYALKKSLSVEKLQGLTIRAEYIIHMLKGNVNLKFIYIRG